MTSDALTDDWLLFVHDLRSPLATVNTYAQLLLRKTAEGGDQDLLAEGLTIIRDAAARIERLIDRLATERGRWSASEVDLVVLANRIVATSDVPPSNTCRATVVSSVPELIGDWDPTDVERVLGNLIDNALKYSAPDRQVRVEVAAVANWAVVTVVDEGIGIPPADASRVFERGYRANNAARRADGLGLGLAGARRLVDGLGGTIQVESEEGSGTRVTVCLPLARQREMAS